jgi:predicted HTH transcriptional regulator
MPDILTPTFDRLCKSGLKASVLMAASNRLVDDVTVTERDLVRAFNYIEQWMQHTLYIIANIGKTASEVNLEKVYNYIKSNPRVSRSRIMQTFRLTARDAEATFMTLEQRGLIHRRKASRGESFETTSPINLKGVQAK